MVIVLSILITYSMGSLSAAPWIPTKTKQRKRLVEIIPIKDNDIIYDLGCGDGSVLFGLSQKNKNVKTFGFEISLFPYFIARARKLLGGSKYKNVTIKYRNLFTQNLKNADIIFIFLLSTSYNKLISKFSRNLKDSCLVVVEAWPLPNLKPHKVVKEDNLLAVYFYKGYQFKDNSPK